MQNGNKDEAHYVPFPATVPERTGKPLLPNPGLSHEDSQGQLQDPQERYPWSSVSDNLGRTPYPSIRHHVERRFQSPIAHLSAIAPAGKVQVFDPQDARIRMASGVMGRPPPDDDGKGSSKRSDKENYSRNKPLNEYKHPPTLTARK